MLRLARYLIKARQMLDGLPYPIWFLFCPLCTGSLSIA